MTNEQIERALLLAERYILTLEGQTIAYVSRANADARAAETHAKRNEFLNDYDERSLRAQTDRTDTLDKVGRFMGGTIEALARIEASLPNGKEPSGG